MESEQKSPVTSVQVPAAPQTQGAALALVPSLWGQAGAVNLHRQALELEESQERVEDVFVLKDR